MSAPATPNPAVRPWRLEGPSGGAANTYKHLDSLLAEVKRHPDRFRGFIARNRETGEVISADEIAMRVSA